MSDWLVTVLMSDRMGGREHLRVVTRADGDNGIVWIGRSGHGNQIVIPRDNVSRRHCCLIVRPDGIVLVKDSGSTNGTWVSGKRVAGIQRFVAGDKIYLGDHYIEIAGPPVRVAPWQVRLEVTEDNRPPRTETLDMQWTADDRHELELDDCTLIINEAGGSWLQPKAAAKLAIDDTVVEDTDPARFPVGAVARTGKLAVRLLEKPIAPPGFWEP